MPERVRVDALFDAGRLRGLGTSQVDGFRGDGPLAVRCREQPLAGPLGSPTQTQQLQEFQRKQSLPVAVTFSLAHPQHLAASVDVPGLSCVASDTRTPLPYNTAKTARSQSFCGALSNALASSRLRMSGSCRWRRGNGMRSISTLR